MPTSLFWSGARRLEADNYLASGFAVRQAITAKVSGWNPLKACANTWQPARLKGIQVAPDFGTPFLAATQVFDLRPVPRKWLSLDRTDDSLRRFAAPGTILLTCSGSVGRATLADASIKNILISHDLLRIDAIDPDDRGWLYAYLRAPTTRSLMTSAQYGHMIKHLEIEHLDDLPFIEAPSEDCRSSCLRDFERIIALRDQALDCTLRAESQFSDLFEGEDFSEEASERPYSVSSAQTFASGRRRFDAWHHNPESRSIEEQLSSSSGGMSSLREIGCTAWLPNRFKRIPADDGVELIDSSSIFEINPDFRRRIAAGGVNDRNNGFVEEGWLLMSRSGQVYGLLGSVAMATTSYAGKVVTDDIIRIVAGSDVHPGYLQLTLSHSSLGRPRVKSLAYGSSIPHIEVEDLLNFRIPRLDMNSECDLGDLVERAYALWAEADQIENAMAMTAERAIENFLR